MIASLTLHAEFLATVPRRGGVDSAEDLGQILANLVKKGETAWPEVALPASVFVRHLAAHAAPGGSARQALSELCVEDLYLACSCAHGSPNATAAFERHLLSRVPGFLARMGASPTFVDEIKQELRIKLLVATPGGAPKIAEYSGRGALASWLRVVTLRTAIDVRRRSEAGAPPAARGANDSDGGFPEAIDVSADPELRYLKDRYAAEFQDALRAGIHALSSERRNVLRLNFVDGLNIDQIGALLHIHRATVARWIVAAREAILREGQRLLRERLGVTPREFESLARLLQSQLDVSLTGLFAEEQEAAPAAKGASAPHDRS